MCESTNTLHYCKNMNEKMTQDPASAHLILDKPLVQKKIDLEVSAGQSYYEVLKQYITKPGVAYVVLVHGVVVDMHQEIQPGDEIRCVPQIVGG